MSVISVCIGKTKYQIDCEAGEEEKIETLANRLNERVNRLSLAIRNADEKTILMFCGVMLEEELEAAKSNSGTKNQTSGFSEADLQNSAINEIETAVNSIQRLISKVEEM